MDRAPGGAYDACPNSLPSTQFPSVPSTLSEPEIAIADEPSDPQKPSPYQNLWVPLVLVPAGIVIAIVLVFALFGALSGDDNTLDENLALVVTGGKNQREQALFSLMSQATENAQALAEGKAPVWEMEEGFGRRVEAALAEIDEDDYRSKLALAVLLASLGEENGVPILQSILELGDDADPDRTLRFIAIQNLGQLGDGRATGSVMAFLDHSDKGLRAVAAIALQNLPGEGVREALEGLLSDTYLDVRGVAAISLSKLDPPAPEGAFVLRDLVDVETYEAANAADPSQFRRGDLISDSRVKAIEGLARLALAEDRALFERLKGDDDLHVSEAAMKALVSLEGR